MNDPIEIADGVSDDAGYTVHWAWDALPASVRRVVVDGGYRIIIARRLGDVYPEHADKPAPGYPDGQTYRSAGGWCFYDRREAAVFEQRLERGLYVATSSLAGTARHEIGHAYDAIIHASASGVFRLAYIEDSCSGESRPYFLQHGDRGYEETFAELFACRVGGGSGADIRGVWPCCDALVGRLLAEGPTALEAGKWSREVGE